MRPNPEYFTPSETLFVETEVKKSKFISTIASVTSKEEFLSFSKKIKAQYPKANHNCFAYIIESPQSPADMGSSDDGEPSGTAGKPILTMLQHNYMGNVVLFVTRFFGGVKLGTGGLVRAYSTAAKTAVERVSVKKIIESRRLHLCVPFQIENAVRNLLSALAIDIIDSKYSEDVSIEIDVNTNSIDDLR